LNDRRIPNPNGVRVVPDQILSRTGAGTGYNPVEANRRASRNGRVSDLPPEIPNAPIRNFFASRYVTCRWPSVAAQCSGVNCDAVRASRSLLLLSLSSAT
jgi:hypothetical protein